VITSPREEMHSTQYDVIIIGAGAAGASAAYFLSQSGLCTIILEKDNLPRYKPCGGGLSLRMLEKYFPFSFEPVIDDKVTSISYFLSEDEVRIPLPEGLMGMVMRSSFDAFILAQSSVETFSGFQVTRIREYADGVKVESGDGKVLQAKYIIGADGSNSIVSRSLAFRRRGKAIPAIEADVEVNSEILKRFRRRPVFIFGAVRRGYCWIFPKYDHLSVGIAENHTKPGRLQKKLVDVMGAFGIPLSGVVLHGHTIPLYNGPTRLASRRCLLIGDAAGLVDPLSGEGIRNAIKSAKIASDAITSGKVSSYSRRIFWQIGLPQLGAYPLRLIFYYLIELCFIFGVYNPFTSQAFMALLSDEIAYGQLLLRIFGTLPAFFVIEIITGVIELAGNKELAARMRSSAYNGWARMED
jgi:geranylgeranyl reductase family protein